jgi:hypothetical protein
MQDLNQLSLALRSGSQGKSDLAGLDEKYADARELRGSQGANINKYGTVSPLALAADVINNSRGRKDMRGIEPQRVNARAAIAENEHALPMYQAQQAKNKVDYDQTIDEQNQTNVTNAATESSRRYGLEKAVEETKRKQAQDNVNSLAKVAADKRTRSTYIHPKTQETVTVAIGPNGQAFAIDGAGTPTDTDITEYVPYKQYADQTAAAATAGGLKANQLQTGLDKLEKKIKPVESMQLALERLDEGLKPYEKGGPKEGEAIGGIGGIGGMRGEGITGHIGDVWRYIDDFDLFGETGDSAEMSNAVAGVIAPIIRNQAGLAQTMSETKKVIDAYGLQSISNEQDMLKALPYIREAIKRDLDRINATTMPQVKDMYGEASGDLNAFDRESTPLDMSQRIEPQGAAYSRQPKATNSMTDAELRAELAPQ